MSGPPVKTWPQFLEETPPDTQVLVVNAVQRKMTPGGGGASLVSIEAREYFAVPEIGRAHV